MQARKVRRGTGGRPCHQENPILHTWQACRAAGWWLFQPMGVPTRLLAFVLLSSLPAVGWADFQYRPPLRVPETHEPFLRHLSPGGDAFPEEQVAEELTARLGEWG